MLTGNSQTRRLPPALRAHESRVGVPIGRYLVENYGSAELADIASDFGVSVRTIARWLHALGIERRLVLTHDADGTASTETSREATTAA